MSWQLRIVAEHETAGRDAPCSFQQNVLRYNMKVFAVSGSSSIPHPSPSLPSPQGTPYEGGLFVFDVFFPSGYPNLPPVMMVYNTGGGKARYNPNLYADGKVRMGEEEWGGQGGAERVGR